MGLLKSFRSPLFGVLFVPLAIYFFQVKNEKHKEKIWREALLHRRLQNRDVEFTHVLQYYDAWEEYADSEEIRRHDSKFIQKFNQEHVEQHTELITTIDESTLDSTMSKSKERDQF